MPRADGEVECHACVADGGGRVSEWGWVVDFELRGGEGAAFGANGGGKGLAVWEGGLGEGKRAKAEGGQGWGGGNASGALSAVVRGAVGGFGKAVVGFFAGAGFGRGVEVAGCEGGEGGDAGAGVGGDAADAEGKLVDFGGGGLGGGDDCGVVVDLGEVDRAVKGVDYQLARDAAGGLLVDETGTGTTGWGDVDVGDGYHARSWEKLAYRRSRFVSFERSWSNDVRRQDTYWLGEVRGEGQYVDFQ